MISSQEEKMKNKTEPKIAKVVFIGLQPNDTSQASESRDKLTLVAGEGIKYDRHCGATRFSDKRETLLIKHGISKDTVMANLRQITIVSRSELELISLKMKLPSVAPYGLLGENIVLDFPDTPNFTKYCIPGTTLLFRVGNTIRPTTIWVTGENEPCHIPAQNIYKHFDVRGKISDFTHSAQGLRGVTGIALVGGKIKKGDEAIIHLPPS